MSQARIYEGHCENLVDYTSQSYNTHKQQQKKAFLRMILDNSKPFLKRHAFTCAQILGVKWPSSLKVFGDDDVCEGADADGTLMDVWSSAVIQLELKPLVSDAVP